MAQNIHRLISSKIKDAISFFLGTFSYPTRQSGKTYLCKQLFPDYESIRNIFHEITKIIKH